MLNKDLMAVSPLYTATVGTMRGYLDAYLSGDDFKRSTRQKRGSEDSKLYEDIIRNTTAQPLARHVVDRIVETVFETGVTRSPEFVGTSDIPEWFEMFLMDVDYHNTSIDAFMEQVCTTVGIFGYGYVFVDRPVGVDIETRPYCTIVSPLNVDDWAYESINGRSYLKYIKVIEATHPGSVQYVVYRIEGNVSMWSRWICNTSKPDEPATLLGEGVFPPGMNIPGFIVRGRVDPRTTEIGVSDIDSVADAMREHYALECEAYVSIIFGKSILRVSPGIKNVPAFAGGIIRGNVDDVEAIIMDLGDVAAIRAQQEYIVKTATELVGMGGLRASKTAVESGVSIIEGRRALHNVAKAKARILESCEQMIYTYAALYMGTHYIGDVRYSKDYSKVDTTYRIALMEKAKMLSGDDPGVSAMINEEVRKLLAVEEDEDTIVNDEAATIPAGIEFTTHTRYGQTDAMVTDVGRTYSSTEAAVGVAIARAETGNKGLN